MSGKLHIYYFQSYWNLINKFVWRDLTLVLESMIYFDD